MSARSRFVRKAAAGMARAPQPDLFANESQPDLFAAEPVVAAYRPDPVKVRARLEKILGEARAAEAMPWDATRANLYRKIVPDMTFWLPDEEGAVWRAAFEAEMARLDPDSR